MTSESEIPKEGGLNYRGKAWPGETFRGEGIH